MWNRTGAIDAHQNYFSVLSTFLKKDLEKALLPAGATVSKYIWIFMAAR
jgi:hypothetical protein